MPDAASLYEGARYEVYIDVRHHHKHGEDDEQRESTCFRVAVTGETPRTPLSVVVDCLRDFADELEEKEADRG